MQDRAKAAKSSNLISGATGDWEVVIGMEVHAQVNSRAKLFSGASTEFGGEPNSHVSLVDAAMPGMLPVIVLMGVLSLGNVLNAGFEQVFVLYSPAVYDSGDVLDTFVYRLGFIDMQYDVSTAVGLFKSAVSFVLICVSYWLAYRYANYRIF